MGKRLISIGPPGAGKGTQAARIRDKYGIAWFSTGDMFRAAISEETPMGLEAKEFVESGELVPDEIVVGVVLERLGRPDCADGYLLDGFPRTVFQAVALDGALGADGIDLVLDLEVDDDVLVARIVERGKRSGRADDTAETARKRIGVYGDETAPVIEHYDKVGIVRRIDGLGTMDEVFDRLTAAIDAD